MLASLALATLSFSGPAVRAPAQSRSVVRMAEFSESVPFLIKADKLGKGMTGDVGFDPLYLSETMDLKWLREAELKHGRVAMLGVVGILVQSVIQIGGPYYSESNPIAAPANVPPEAWAQIILACGAFEFVSNKGKMTMADMFSDSSRVPGNLGFDPMNMGKDASKRSTLELQELKNGRLAMLGFAGLLHQFFITDSLALKF
mmetsp:Transcript_6828/g.17464  ORF Transcript_6828/g.17464 Transcript_6828/m.17464 type:complete len:202 (+) Transcript_6828:26-631(+)